MIRVSHSSFDHRIFLPNIIAHFKHANHWIIGNVIANFKHAKSLDFCRQKKKPFNILPKEKKEHALTFSNPV